MDDLFEKMKKLIADRLEIDEAKITLDSSFRQDLGADSLDTYELVYAIEEELELPPALRPHGPVRWASCFPEQVPSISSARAVP